MKEYFRKEKVIADGIVLFPRVLKSRQDTITPTDIETKSLPVGRVSVDTVGFGELLRDLISEMRSVGAAYPLEYLEAMQNLSLINPDVAQMIDNIVQLGNTGHKVMFETDREQVRQAATEELNRFNMTVFGRFGGIDGFVNSALAQIGRGGAISIEWVVNEDLTGIDKAVFVPLKEIRFLYDPDSGEYAPHQKTCDLTQGEQGLIALNTATYQYCAMQTLDNSPYAVPPILSALESITIQRDIVKNLRFIAKKMGLLGFVNFLIRAPKQSPGEKTEEYIARCQGFLDDQAQRLKHNYRDGIAVGFMDSFTVEHHSITGDATGAKDLFEMNEQQVFSGLKADPALHGRTYSTTETYAGVVYEKMLSIITNYQRTVRCVLEYGYKLHLTLLGIDYKNLWIEFEPSKSLSAQRDEATYATKLANLKTLYDQGIIDQNQFAQEAGYDQPAEERPRDPFVIAPTDTADAAQFKSAFGLVYDKSSGSYRLQKAPRAVEIIAEDDVSQSLDIQEAYLRCLEGLDKHFPSCCQRRASLELNPAQERVDRFQKEYFASVYPVLRGSRKNGARHTYKHLKNNQVHETKKPELFEFRLFVACVPKGIGFGLMPQPFPQALLTPQAFRSSNLATGFSSHLKPLKRKSPNSLSSGFLLHASPNVHYANPFGKEIYSDFRITIREYNPLTYKEIADNAGVPVGRYMTKGEVWAEEQSRSAPLCKCGCNRKIVITSRHRYRGIPEYLPYHQPDFQKSKQPEVES